MTERTITKEELEAVMADQQGLSHAIFHAVVEAAFPPIFKAKDGEVIWVRNHDAATWVLKVFIGIYKGLYRVENGEWFLDWNQAKPLTPTQKGE